MKHAFSRRLSALALALVLALSLAAPAWAADPVTPPAILKAVIHPESVNLELNQEMTLQASTVDEKGMGGGVNDDFTWESSDPAIVTVDEHGVIKGVNVSSGNPVTITATLKDDPTKVAACTVSVFLPSKITAVKLDKYGPSNPLRLEVGKSEILKATVEPKTEDQTVTWTTGDPLVATVDASGKVTAVGKGDTTITATASDGQHTAECVVVVSEAIPTLRLSDLNLVLKLNEPRQLVAYVEDGPAGSWIKWTSSNSSAVKVDTNGEVTALKANIKVTITAALMDKDNKPVKGAGNRNLTAACSAVATDDKSVIITGVTLNESSHSIPEGGTFQLTATVYPSNATDKTVLWSSSNDKVATVKDGKVTTEGAGTATITVTTLYGNRTATCVVTVSPAATSLTPITGSGVYSELSKKLYTFGRNSKSTTTVTTTRLPADSLDPIQWQSKDATVVSAGGTDTTGTLTRRGPGKATVTAVPLGPDGKPRANVTPMELEVTVSGIAFKASTVTIGEYRRDSLEWNAYGDAADSNLKCDEWMSTDPAVVTVDANGLITARSKGSAVITAKKNGYEATCTVNVVEDTSAIITLTGSHPAGSPVNMSTASATSSAGSGTLASVLDSISRAKTRTLNADGTQTAGYGLLYVTNLSVASTDQGILHDQHHSSADTGAGVGVQDIYYPGTAPQGQRSLKDLSFVPRTTFSGTAEISYTGRASNNTTFNGVIRVPVNGTGDVMYSSSEGSVVNFLSDDFNHYHPNLRSVSFTPPLDSRGTLYYNYTSASQPGTKVTAGTQYYRTSSPAIDRVSFVPAQGFEGSVSIAYQGKDTNDRSITGTVRITVTNNKGGSAAPGDIYYRMKEDSWTTFRPADFQRASQAVLGESLAYVRFVLPPSSEGTLFYNYRGFGDYDSAVASTTSYYYGGTPALSGVAFVPTTTSPSQVDISYTGYTVRGNTFTGTIHVGQEDSAQQGGLYYTVSTGRSVYFNAYDFNAACVAATGASLSYVQFTQLPAVGQGALRYTRGNSSGYNDIATTTRCYRSASNTWDVQLSNVSFLANSTYTGTVTIPFVGYNTNNSSFTGQVTIQVTPPTAGDSVFSGTTASPIRLSSSRMRSICSGALSGDLSYITFTSLPSSAAGRLYLNYNGFRTGTQVNTGTRYYVSSSPGIDQLSFVPRGRYSGQVTVGYTATDTGGRTASGLLTFNITSTGSSNYFSDLGGHTWAAPAVDYLYQNGVTKGVTPSSFGPEQRILRCDFVLMLCRAFGFGETGGYSFADVPTNAYYAGAVAAAKQRGVINGDGRNFMPNSELTRQDAMVMIYNAMKAAGWSVSSSTSILGRFPDGTAVSSYARDAVSTLVQMGAVNGDNGMLYPYNPITRAEAAVILHFVMTM